MTEIIYLDDRRRKSAETRVDGLLTAVKSTPCERPFLSARNVDGSIRLDIGGLEVWESPDAADRYANEIKEAVRRAKEEK